MSNSESVLIARLTMEASGLQLMAVRLKRGLARADGNTKRSYRDSACPTLLVRR